MEWRKNIIFILVIAFLGFSLASHRVASTPLLSIGLSLPPGTLLEAEKLQVSGDPQIGKWNLTLPNPNSFPLQVKAIGPFGEQVVDSITSLAKFQNYHLPFGIESQAASNPEKLTVLPQLCPRLTPRVQGNPAVSTQTFKTEFTYHGEQDPLNHRPTFQLLDPDATQGKQALTLKKMDGRNVLLVKNIRVTYDYEDSNHIEYESTDPKTGEKKIYYEDERGFYSNFQYAVVPFSEQLASANTQTLLHLGQGTLDKIGRENLKPELRTHSFLPGPYLSKREYFYELCEWGDTARHAKEQRLNYQNLALWDWDYPLRDNHKVLLIVWESDEEELDPNFAHFPKNYLIDDLIGVFPIERSASLKPLTLRNPSGDFEITVQTGDFEEKS